MSIYPYIVTKLGEWGVLGLEPGMEAPPAGIQAASPRPAHHPPSPAPKKSAKLAVWGKCDLGLVEPPSSNLLVQPRPAHFCSCMPCPVPSNSSLALPALPVRKKAAPLIPAWNPPSPLLSRVLSCLPLVLCSRLSLNI